MMLKAKSYKDAFENKLRNKIAYLDNSVLSTGTVNSGHDIYALPYSFEGDYRKWLEQENLFRRYSTVLTVNRPDGAIDAIEPLDDAEITDENHLYPYRPQDFAKMNYMSYKLAMTTTISATYTNDMDFDLCSYVYQAFGKSFGRAEENLCLNGTGVNEPLGLLHAADVGVTASRLETDAVIELFFSLDKQYRKNAVWIMNDETAMALRMMKDNSGRYIWRESDDSIFSRTVLISNYITDSSIIFGDLSYLWLVERQPLAVKFLNEMFAIVGGIGLAACERFDAKLIRKDAVKIMKVQ